MVQNFVDMYPIYGVFDTINSFTLKKYQSTSEEEFLGIGLGNENFKEWIGIDFSNVHSYSFRDS